MIALTVALACRSFDLGEIEVTADPDLPTVLRATWDWEGPGDHHVEVSLDGAVVGRTPIAETPDLFVLGLAADRRYELVAVTREGDRRYESAPVPFHIDPRPDDLPAFEIAPYDVDDLDEAGFVLLTFVSDEVAWIVILDRDGDYVWWRRVDADKSAVTVEASRDGLEILVSQAHRGQTVDVGSTAHHPIRGGDVRTTRTPFSHHDFAERSDGRIAFLAQDVLDGEIDGAPVRIRSDALRVAEASATDDDVPEELFTSVTDLGREPWYPCDHAQELAPTPLGPAYDLTHANSLVLSADGSATFVNSRYLDALLKIDSATGALLWQLGGEDSDFTSTTGPLFRHGHLSQMFDDGFVMFDNGNHKAEEISGIAEYRWNEEALTVTEVFRYDSPDGWFVRAIGDAKRLSNGSYLVAWGDLGTLQEISPDGRVVWEAVGPEDTLVARFQLHADLYDLSATPQ